MQVNSLAILTHNLQQRAVFEVEDFPLSITQPLHVKQDALWGYLQAFQLQLLHFSSSSLFKLLVSSQEVVEESI